jgi:hypothetical protein
MKFNAWGAEEIMRAVLPSGKLFRSCLYNLNNKLWQFADRKHIGSAFRQRKRRVSRVYMSEKLLDDNYLVASRERAQ